MKNIFIILLSVISFSLTVIFFSYDLFYSLTLFIIGLTSFYGLFNNNHIWYHKSAHIIVASLMGIILFVFDLLKYFSNWLAYALDPNNFPTYNISIFIFGVICILLFRYEFNYLKKKK
ncbi:MAG: hypothetical protein PWP28_1972 [Oceanotoga sp.]|jgi:hypothetical protein|uniref:hypothetical protein n=1 Tax=Oceanotoga sp. TaxID=2108366 RepID=UPI0026566048|nr:hypothetical protein [Oceanotoga sp.]MDN5343097.1 hypothetical protein [Oceanotoga sp.]